MNKLNSVRASATLGLAALFSVLLVGVASATTPTAGETAANTAVADAASSASSIITTNIPVVLGVAVLWVAMRFGKRFISSLG